MVDANLIFLLFILDEMQSSKPSDQCNFYRRLVIFHFL